MNASNCGIEASPESLINKTAPQPPKLLDQHFSEQSQDVGLIGRLLNLICSHFRQWVWLDCDQNIAQSNTSERTSCTWRFLSACFCQLQPHSPITFKQSPFCSSLLRSISSTSLRWSVPVWGPSGVSPWCSPSGRGRRWNLLSLCSSSSSIYTLKIN